MLTNPDKVVPFMPAPSSLRGGLSGIVSGPGLGEQAIQGLAATYPGTLTAQMRALLRTTCGLTAAELGAIDFTSHWHPEEPLSVFRPCITLAIDDEGRRWIAETSRARGLPGPIWCVLPDPAVSLRVCNDLGDFLRTLEDAIGHGQLCRWLRRLHRDACDIWTRREALARASRDQCVADHGIRAWLAALPFDVHVYDLRNPDLQGWPHGLAGPEGRLYRCGTLPVFAVSAAPTASRWSRHMSQIATGDLPKPAVAQSLAA